MIRMGKYNLSSAILTVLVMTLSPAAIISLLLYSDSRADHLYANVNQIHVLSNSWHTLEQETANLLTEPAAGGDERKWLYSVRIFDAVLKTFLRNPQTNELAAENQLFERKLNEINQLWLTLKDKIEPSTSYLNGRVKANRKNSPGASASCEAGEGNLLYRMGYLSGEDGLRALAGSPAPAQPQMVEQDNRKQLAQLANDCRYILSTSRTYYTVLIDEMTEIMSGRTTQQIVHTRLITFVLSMVIIVLMVFFMAQVQRKYHLRRLGLEQLVNRQTSELEAEKDKAEAARLQTEQINRQLQASVGHANLMAQQTMEVSRVRSEFLTKMSHEIRIPMNAIMGFSEMLAEENLSAQQKEQIGIIRDSGTHLLQLINDILDFSKVEAGKLEIEVADCNIGNVLAAVESLIRPAATEKKLQFEIIRNEPLPEFIRTDPARLKQCLLNLVSNAIKFTDNGYVYVRVFWDNSGSKPAIRFDVEDTGAGIPSERQQRIFEPFSRINSDTTTRKFSGTGLGLAITQRLAELLGGSVTVSSTVGKGSIFTLRMPTGMSVSMPMAKAVKNETSQTSVAVGQNDKPSQSFAKAGAGPANTRDVKLHGRVLIAEDSPTNQALARLLLNKMGLETVIVENGELAIQKIMNENFDVVFMDIQMPVMNGYEATRLLREKGFKRPIIALTACAMKGDDEKCFAAGCSDYLSKPIDRKKLVDTLLKYFSVTSTNCPDTIANAKEKSMETVKQQELAECSGSPEIEIDWHLLMERIGSEELVDEIIPIFIKDNIQRMQMLSQAVEKNDINEVKFYAHSLKGASGTVGATKLSELGRQLENDARNSDDSNFKPVFKEMSERFSRLIDFLAKSDWKQIAQQASSEHQAGKS